MKKPPLVRITVTIPKDLLARADDRAARERRPRSWVVAEALRRFLDERAPARAVREPAPAPYAVSPGLGEQRTAQLEADLTLTPTQRVRESQEGFETALKARPQPRFGQILQFDAFEDYLAWKKRDVLW